MEVVLSLLIILAASTFAGGLFRFMKLPAVVGQLLVGIILGPAVFNLLHPSALISEFAEIGVIVLMFQAGIEAELPLLKRYFKPALTVGLGGIALPFLVFFLLGRIWQVNIPEALFWGLIFSATSVSITVEVLKEMGKIRSTLGATILGAAVIDDIVAVLAVSVFTVIFGGSGGQVGAQRLLLEVILMAVFILGVLAFAKWLAKPVLRFVSRIPMEGIETLVSLIICLLFAYLAHAAGLSSALGAFFAGLIISDTDTPIKLEETEKNVTALGSFCFIPVFFASIGLNLSVKGLSSQWLLIILMSILAIVTKLFGAGLGELIGGGRGEKVQADGSLQKVPPLKRVLRLGSGMVPRGEMALIVSSMALSSGILPKDYYSAIVIAIIVSTLAAPLLLKAAFRRDT